MGTDQESRIPGQEEELAVSIAHNLHEVGARAKALMISLQKGTSTNALRIAMEASHPKISSALMAGGFETAASHLCLFAARTVGVVDDFEKGIYPFPLTEPNVATNETPAEKDREDAGKSETPAPSAAPETADCGRLKGEARQTHVFERAGEHPQDALARIIDILEMLRELLVLGVKGGVPGPGELVLGEQSVEGMHWLLSFVISGLGEINDSIHVGGV